MTVIRHIVEPSRLVLSWQPPAGHRSRLAIGEIFRRSDVVIFRYLFGTPEFEAARSAEFQGYPAFSLAEQEHVSGVLETFLTRLPGRGRQDFADFLEHHHLPDSASLNDFSLLGYTGAKLPSDSFELIPLFDDHFLELELVLEACGFRHQGIDLTAIQPGAAVEFLPESNNAFDTNAVIMSSGERKIGYVNRVLSPIFSQWLRRRQVSGRVDRINGRTDHPLVYVFVEVGAPALAESP